MGNSLVVQWLGLRASTAGGMSSIPGQGTKIPQAKRHGQKEKILRVLPIHSSPPFPMCYLNNVLTQLKCPLTDEWIKKRWHIYTMEYYPAIKRNEIELFVVRWMDLESVIQSELSQKEKNKYSMLTHI